MKKITAAIFLLTAFVIASFGQSPTRVHLSYATKIISETNAELIITAKMDKGWHIYSMNPGGDGSLIAPEITFTKNNEVELIGSATEKGKLETQDDAGIGPYHFFENKVVYTQKIKYKNKIKIKGEFYYQTCNENGCLKPTSVDFVIDMNENEDTNNKTKVDTLVKDTLVAMNTDTTPDTLAQATGRVVYGEFGTIVGDCGGVLKKELSVWTALLYGILGGFAALFFPCTLPMIPMTISFFLKGSGDKKRGVRNGITYGFFIFLVYFLLSLPFLFLGWGGNALNSFSTNVWVNLSFFAIFLVFAFSLFGFYDISLPASIANKVDEKSNIGSISGIFFMALTLAIVSFSCTGPVLGLVLGNISNSKLITPAMSGFGIGLGIPFALFAIFPNLLKALPKSGGWLTVVKVVFGFIELAFALKFFSNADLVKQWGLLKRELFIGIWIIISILTALYLLGIFTFKKDPSFKSTIPMKVLAALAIIFAGYLSLDFMNKEISLVSGFPPPKFYSWFHKEEKLKNGSGARTHDLKGLKVYLYLEDALAEGKKQNKPVMIDFTGWACVNCRKMEENVWTKPAINNLLREKYIIASLYVDEQIELPANQRFASSFLDKKWASTVGDKWFDLSLRNFKSATQPYYALIDPIDHRILNTPKGFTPNEEEYSNFLKCGLLNFTSLHH
jgi:thiol:disulfide interchange protein DsbD